MREESGGQRESHFIRATASAKRLRMSGPSNLLLFNVATDVPQWAGAVSVGTSPTDGILQ